MSNPATTINYRIAYEDACVCNSRLANDNKHLSKEVDRLKIDKTKMEEQNKILTDLLSKTIEGCRSTLTLDREIK